MGASGTELELLGVKEPHEFVEKVWDCKRVGIEELEKLVGAGGLDSMKAIGDEEKKSLADMKAPGQQTMNTPHTAAELQAMFLRSEACCGTSCAPPPSSVAPP